MSRLSMITNSQAQLTVEQLYRDMERRISASASGLCPIAIASSFLSLCHVQSCGKCIPCRIGLGTLQDLMEKILDGEGTMEMIDQIEHLANTIAQTADCAIGFEAARMILVGLKGFRDDFECHVKTGRCILELNQPIPCITQCPAGVDIPGYIALVHEGRYADAVRLIRRDNPFPSACGLICEHPCEVRCRRGMLDAPVNIRGLKRFAVEHAGEVALPLPSSPTGKKIAIIGGGPAGISCAYYLTLMGHSVKIFEQRKKLGGMLRYGIPSYRLPREALDAEINQILALGIEVETEISIGETISIADLRKEYDAVYIAIGAQTHKALGFENEDAEGVISAVEMLRSIGDDDLPDYSGKRVVVIGGGNVAMDVSRSSVRLGAENTTIVYRRRAEDMTAQAEEVTGAIEEGCHLMELYAPARIEVDDKGHVAALWVKPQIIGPYQKGRPTPVPADADEIRIPCDMLIIAIGQGIETQPLEEYGIPVTRGRIRAASSAAFDNVEIPGVFAGGDCVTGPATVIRAIAGGKVAAANIDEYLGFHHMITCDVEIPSVRLENHFRCGRVNMKELPAADRMDNFAAFECGMTLEEAMQESSRCLRCDHFGHGTLKTGRVEKW